MTRVLVAHVFVGIGDALEAVGALLGLGRVIAYAVAETAIHNKNNRVKKKEANKECWSQTI